MNGEKVRKAELLEARTLRQAATKRRKQRALALLADGATMTEAARAVRADERTVKAWRSEATK